MPSSLWDLSRPAAETGDSARISRRFRHLCSHKLLKLMKILTRTPIPSVRRSKSDRLLEDHRVSDGESELRVVAPLSPYQCIRDLPKLGLKRLLRNPVTENCPTFCLLERRGEGVGRTP